MNFEDFYKDWLAKSGIDRGKNDAISFLRFFGVPTAAEDYQSQYDVWNQGRDARNQTFQDFLSRFQNVQPQGPDRSAQFAQNAMDQFQSGRNVARAAGIGQRMGGANAYARGLMGNAQQEGEGLASRFGRQGLSSAAQAGALLGTRNAARGAGNAARLGAMSPASMLSAAQQQAGGYGMATQGFGQEQQYQAGRQASAMQQLQQLLGQLQGMQGVYNMQRPDMSNLLNMSQAFSQWQGTKPKKQGTNWGGLLGGVANIAGAIPGIGKLFNPGGGSNNAYMGMNPGNSGGFY